MSHFINDDFLLQSEFARRLYHDHVKELPIIDYHNHLSPKDIAQKRSFSNITQAWLEGDHYKWRAMRCFGIEEKYITGNADDQRKFSKWAGMVSYTLRNPLFHWTHLELKRYFGIDELLTQSNASKVYHSASELLREPSHNTLGLLTRQNVEVLCTTDDPTDDLKWHRVIENSEDISIKVHPTFRPDKALAIENTITYLHYLEDLSMVTQKQIVTYRDLIDALKERIDYFHDQGCRLADHGLEQFYLMDQSNLNAGVIFDKLLSGLTLSKREIQQFKMETLLYLCECYHEKGWVQQFHLGAIRNNNKRLFTLLGPDTGFDSIGDFTQTKALGCFLNALEENRTLTKTIVYNLNPADNETIATMLGNFNDGSTKGKIQYGAAWWFLDQKQGIENQINTLSNVGLLSCFVGMLTDSRSFLSFPRHEYFRRILCNMLGNDVVNGALPNDEQWLGTIAADICYHNAKNYFRF